MGIFGKLCTIRKINGKEYIEIDPEIDVHKTVLPVNST